MLSFARWNNAAKFKYPIHLFIFVPLHVLYLASILAGVFWSDMMVCDTKINRVYPRIFYYQYSLFYATYIIFVVLHRKGYFLEWHRDTEIL